MENNVNNLNNNLGSSQNANKPNVSNAANDLGSSAMQSTGVPKPLADMAIKSNGGAMSPTNLPGSSGLSGLAKNQMSKSGSADAERLNDAKNRGMQHNMLNSKNSSNNGEQKSKVDQVGEEVTKQAASAGIQAATGGAVPKPVADLVSDKLAGPMWQQFKKQQKRRLIIGAGAAFGGLMLIIVVMGAIFSVIAAVADALQPVTNFFGSLGNWFAGNGWCPTVEACEEKAENEFFEKINLLYNEYQKYGVSLDTELLTGAALYNNFSDFNGISSDLEADDIEDVTTDDIDNYINGKARLVVLAKNLANVNTGENDYLKFKRYITSTYVDKYYSDLLSGDDENRKQQKEQIAIDILSFSANSDIFEAVYKNTGIYQECPGVTVVDENGSVEGTYNLEDYVAGVLAHEVNNTWGEEALKAHAVAVRTYTISRTDKCTKSIENSTRAQTFKETDDPVLIAAVQDTAGEVLLFDNEIFSAEYSAWYNPSICKGDMTCDDKTCTVDMVKLPNKEEWQFTMDKNYFTYGGAIGSNLIKDVETLGGHCRGMSQFGIKYLDLGLNKDYKEIIETFYSDGVTFGKLTVMDRVGLIAGDYEGFYERIEPYNSSVLEYQCGVQVGGHTLGCGNFAQCVWYVKRRAIEIFNTLEGIDEETRQKAITAIYYTYGNGRDWWDSAIEKGGTLSIFGASTDYTQPKVGSIVVWEFTEENANANYNGHNYGHVAIVEKVNADKGTVVVTEGWRKGGNNGSWDSGENWSQAGFQRREQTYEELANRSGYVFRGYVYLLN